MKSLYFIAALFISFAAHSVSYSTMVIDSVKNANGVWTAAGVMDTAGFVRTTGAVSVAGRSVSVPLSLTVDIASATTLLKSSSRLLGPVALAATAYSVYEWITVDNGYQASGNNWVTPTFNYNSLAGYSYNIASYSGTVCSNCTYAEAQSKFMTNLNASFGPLAFTSGPSQTIVVMPGVYRTNTSCTSRYSSSSNPTCVMYSLSSTDINTHTSTDAEFNTLTQPSNQVIADAFNKIPSLIANGLPIISTSFEPFSEWSSEPYYKDGYWYQDRMDVSSCPTSSELNRVCVSLSTVKHDITDPKTKPSAAASTYSTSPSQQENFCQQNPQSIACLAAGDVPFEPLPVTELPVNPTYNAWGASTASCPAPVSITDHMGKQITISYQTTCEFLTMLRPVIIAIAWAAAAFILFGFPKVGGGE